MRSLLKYLTIVGLTCFLGTSLAAERGTAKEAEAMVHKAIDFTKANGLEKTLNEINNPAGSLVDRDLYIAVADQEGKALAHGGNPRMIGKDLSALKDMNGKQIYKEVIAVARAKGKGWVDYTWPNPVTQKLEAKTTYLEKFQDVIFVCGAYK